MVGYWSGELVAEMFGYCLGFGMCLVVEGDGLVLRRRSVGPSSSGSSW